MNRRKAIIMMVAVTLTVFLTGQVMAKPIEIQWWHAMRGARGETVKKIVDAFNASQKDFVIIETNKGNYDETVNAGVAAYRAKKQPHILQSFEVGTQTMMLSGAIYPVYKLMADQGYKVDWKLYLQPVLSYYVDDKGNLSASGPAFVSAGTTETVTIDWSGLAANQIYFGGISHLTPQGLSALSWSWSTCRHANMY